MSSKGKREMTGKMASNISLLKVMITIINKHSIQSSNKLGRNYCVVNVMNLIIDIKNLSKHLKWAIIISKNILN
jgi:hypothetical protein